jgi:hypothetical protein
LRNYLYNDICCASNAVRVIMSRNMRRVGNVAHTRDKRYAYSVWLGHVKERGHLEDLGIVCVGILLKWILIKLVGRV